MAYVADNTDPNAPQGAPGQSMTGGQPSTQLPATSSGQGGGVTGNTSAAGSPQGAAAVTGSTKAPPVQDLAAYLRANQPQAVQMGENIAGNLTNTANQVTGDINTAQQNFDQQVQSSNVTPNQQLVSEAAANPAAFVENPGNVAAFQQQENAAYTGPTSFETSAGYQPLQQEVTNAQAQAPNISNPANIEQLVAGQETNPTLGMTNLDALLLQETPASLAPITAAEAPYANLGTALKNAASTEDIAAQTAAANDAAAAAGVNSAFLTGPNAEVPGWEQAVQNELSQAQQGTTAYNTDVQNQIEEYNSLFPVISGYEQANPNLGLAAVPTLQQPVTGSPTLATVATPQDYATEAALQELLGSNAGVLPLNEANAAEAGSYVTPTYNPVNIQSYLNPLTQSAAENVLAKDYPNLVAPQNPKYSAAENAMLDVLLGGNPNTGPEASLQTFLRQLAQNPNAPTDLTLAKNDPNVLAELNAMGPGENLAAEPYYQNLLNNTYTFGNS